MDVHKHSLHLHHAQIFPFELEPHFGLQDRQQVIQTALDRRIKYFNQFSTQLRHHQVVELMEHCLSDNPLNRPTANQLEGLLGLMAQVCSEEVHTFLLHFFVIYVMIKGSTTLYVKIYTGNVCSKSACINQSAS